MSHGRLSRLGFCAIAGVVGLWGCQQDSPTSPGKFGEALNRGPVAALGTTSYPVTVEQGKAKVCKSSDSPAGTYNFNVSASPVVAGDLSVTSVALTPGTCSVVFERPTAGGPVVQVTVTEVIAGGATYHLDHIIADDFTGTRNLAGPSATIQLNGYHGASTTFYNAANAPSGPGTGHVVVCKSANSPAGTFTFNVNAVGTVSSDVVKNTINLTAGSCDTVFVRVAAQNVAATITVTESVAANANTFLQAVTVDGNAAATVGAGVVVTQNLNADRVVVFINASATVGASVAYHPTSQTPGVVHLCKSANSPPGTFNFTVNAIGTVATDQVVSNVSLTAGTCKVIFIRTVPQALSATLTVTETINLGATFVVDRIAKITTSGISLTTGLGTIIVNESGLPGSGTLLLFFNKTISILP